jgi:valyl-tRNA synthetase
MDVIRRLARLSSMSILPEPPGGSVLLVVRGQTVALPLKGIIDFVVEQKRLEKEIARAVSDIARVDAKLNNDRFLANVPEEVVEEEREKRAEAELRREKLCEALQRLRGAEEAPPVPRQ